MEGRARGTGVERLESLKNKSFVDRQNSHILEIPMLHQQVAVSDHNDPCQLLPTCQADCFFDVIFPALLISPSFFLSPGRAI